MESINNKPIDEQILETLKTLYTKPMSFDNTGILVPFDYNGEYNKIVITIDLTSKIIEKYLNEEKVIFISYHPTIFNPLKRISTSLKQLIKNFGLISPHTMLDPEMNLRLAFLTLFDYEIDKEIHNWRRHNKKEDALNLIQAATYKNNPKASYDATICLVENKKGIKIEEIITNIKNALGIPSLTVYPSFAVNHFKEPFKYLLTGVGASSFSVENIYSMFTFSVDSNPNLDEIKDSVILVGEMKHHEILKLQENNTIIVTGHSQSERFFLKYLQKDLQTKGYENVVIADESESFKFF